MYTQGPDDNTDRRYFITQHGHHQCNVVQCRVTLIVAVIFSNVTSPFKAKQIALLWG